MPETNSTSTSTMEWWANKGTSTYHRFIAHFVRDGSSLLRVNGPRSSELKDSWSEVEPKMNAPTEVRGLQRHEVKTEKSVFTLFEKEVEGVNCGVCLLSPDDGENPIDAFMSAILIKQARLVYDTTPSVVNSHVKRLANELTDLFDEFLRYEVPDDYWKRGGRDVFYERVEYFVSRDMMIEFVLPAFPCKSSNLDKVGGNKPDRGEELALRRLHAFIAEVEEIYEPGGKMWVVSDGHVFSDCIGVDDEEVDTYTSQLIAMNEVIAEATDSAHRVGFFGLVDLFDLDATPEGIEAVRSSLPIPKLDHHVETTLTDEAETCRQILMGGCTCEAQGVRARIDGKDPSIMALYKGFGRFMLEDLDLNKGTKHMTKSQKRKTSTKVAFEMILRNQAYSNLVEMVFPNHCRLSIHAHKNSGPKFGIQLFDPRFVRTTNSLDVLGKPIEQVDLLHIPTPWHNSIVEIEGSDVIWVCKSSLARESVKQGKFLGQWEMGPNAVGASFRYLSTIPQSPLIIKLPEQAWPKASDAICSPIATRRPTFKIHGAQAPSSGFPAPVRQTTWSRNAVNAMPRSAAGKPLMTVNVPGANKVATPVEKKSLASAPIVEEVNPEDSPTSEKGIAPTALPLRQATAQ